MCALYLFSRYLPPERAFALTLLMDIMLYSFSIGSGVWYAFRGGLKAKDKLLHLALPAGKLAWQVIRQKRVFIAEDFVFPARRAEDIGTCH